MTSKPSRLLLAVLSFVLLPCFAGEAFACSCMGERAPCEAYWESDAIFVGTVTGVEVVKVFETGVSFYEQRLVRFAVAETLRGPGTPEAEVVTGMGGGDCGYPFRQGVAYVVYASRSKQDGRLHTGICNRTRTLERAGNDLEYARGLATAEPGGTIFGEVRKRNHARQEGEEWFKPVASAELTIEGEAAGGELTRREVKSDERGAFSAKGLPPGTYVVKLKVPAGLASPEQPDGGEGQTLKRQSKIEARGCAQTGFLLEADTRVGGRVLDASGQPVSNVPVRLRNAPSNKGGHQIYRPERTDGEGRFEFKLVPPGDYLLVFSYRGERGGGESGHPSTPPEERAELVKVREGEQLRGLELRLPLSLNEYEVEGFVALSDGRPAPGASIYLFLVGGGDPSNLDDMTELRADAQGRFTLKVYEGLRYKVTTIPPNVVGGRDPSSRWVDVPPAPGHPPLKLPALELIKK